MFWKAWKPNQQAMPAAASRPKTSSVRAAIASARQIDDAEQRDQHAGAEQAELLARDGEDEVGVLLGHEAGPGLRAVEEPLAEEAAVADRDPRLLDVVAGAARVEVGVGEGQEAVDLVLLQEARRRPRRPRRSTPPAASSASQRRGAPETASDAEARSPRARAWCRGRAGAGSARRARRRSPASRPRRRRRCRRPRRARTSARSATHSAIPITTASLANSDGWIDIPPSCSQDREPLIVRAHRQHEHQPGDRAEVDQRRDDPHPAVVGGQHQRPSAPAR